MYQTVAASKQAASRTVTVRASVILTFPAVGGSVCCYNLTCTNSHPNTPPCQSSCVTLTTRTDTKTCRMWTMDLHSNGNRIGENSIKTSRPTKHATCAQPALHQLIFANSAQQLANQSVHQRMTYLTMPPRWRPPTTLPNKTPCKSRCR